MSKETGVEETGLHAIFGLNLLEITFLFYSHRRQRKTKFGVSLSRIVKGLNKCHFLQ